MKCESPGVLLLCLNLDQGLTDRLVNRHAVTVAAAVVRSESRLRRHCGLPPVLRWRHIVKETTHGATPAGLGWEPRPPPCSV